VFALWPVSILPEIRAALAAPTDLGAGRFQSRFPVAFADWPCSEEADPFFNLNTPEDLARARSRLARDAGRTGGG
jgi:molybdopterin-guanine dinucleotide biosynthesis protein A